MGSQNTPLVIAALILVQVLFGVNYVVSKMVVGVFPPLLWASLRIIISSGLMVGVALALKRKHPTMDRHFFGPLVGLALLGTVINQSSFLVGLHYTTPTNSAILNTMIPIFTLMVVTLRRQEPFTIFKGVGFVFAFSGVLILRKIEHFTLSDRTVVGDLLTLLNCLSYALFLSYGRKFLQTHDRIWTTCWLFMYGSVGLGVLALPDWVHFEAPTLTGALWASMVFAILGGTLVTYFLNNWALAKASSSSVALFIYLQPVVASVLAWVWLGETVTLRTFLSSLLVFIGVLIALVGPSFGPALKRRT
ncbi:DMT family transporter [Bdellovibrionota bacterium FG-2]